MSMIFDLPADWVLKDIVPIGLPLPALPALQDVIAVRALDLPYIKDFEAIVANLPALPDVPPCVSTLEEWNRYAAIVR